MTNHPNRSQKQYTISVVRRTASGLITADIRETVTGITRAHDLAKRLAGPDCTFVYRYGPDASAFVGNDVTAVIAW
jgi:hypothetical protein